MFRIPSYRLKKDKTVEPIIDELGNLIDSMTRDLRQDDEFPGWRTVCRTKLTIGGNLACVSTVFLPGGHSSGGQPFETLAQIAEPNQVWEFSFSEIIRYSSWKEAERGHRQAVKAMSRMPRAKRTRNPFRFKNRWVEDAKE